MSNLINQSFNCIRCNQCIEINKQGFIKCSCGADLFVVKTSGKYSVCDVTFNKTTVDNDAAY